MNYIISQEQKIYYSQHINQKSDITILWLGGFMSDMEGTKALFLEDYAKYNNINYIRFDYMGHGISGGEFKDGNISIWSNNAVDVIKQLVKTDKIILIGSSMGGWIMNLVALQFKDKVKGMIGLASAPDFTKYLMWDKFNDDQKQFINNNGYINIDSHDNSYYYPITKKLIDDGNNNNLILNDNIDLDIPIYLIHGIKDCDVHYKYSIELMNKYISEDVEITLLKNADHRVSDEVSLNLISDKLNKLIDRI